MRGRRLLGQVVVWLVSSIWATPPTMAADTQCGGQACEESALCASPDVLECADWNDGTYDGWSVSSSADRKGGNRGDVKAGVGLGGTAAWAARIVPGSASTVYFDKGVNAGRGPVHGRFYLKLSANYRHRMRCGLQKLFYFWATNGGQRKYRIMLGITQARDMSRFSDQPDSVGVIGFDYSGHIVRLPDRPEDNPVLIHPGRWYSVEIMTEYSARDRNTVKIWIDGQLQMVRTNYDDPEYDPQAVLRDIQDSTHFGGLDNCSSIVEEQWVYKDNHVISRSYIGPIVDIGPPGKPSLVP